MTHRFHTTLLALLLAFSLVPLAMAAGSTSGSSRPAQPDTYDRAVTAVKAENYRAALPLLERVVARNPNHADAWNWIGFSHRKLAQYDRALKAYRRALDIDPQHKGALEYLGELYVQTGQLDKANEQLRKLKDACGLFGCEEYDDLEQAIARSGASKG
jgi:tetratricopeptide (TPR) repeat protein